MSCCFKQIAVGARDSALSRAQVEEVLQELRIFYSEVSFVVTWKKTTGDLDLITSLRTREKTDFFTKEIDESLLQGECRIGIHSAKDLPEVLAPGLCVVAYTRGIDQEDVLVLRPGDSFASLPSKSRVGTSSQKREENCCLLRPDMCFVDIRGNIQQRLALLDKGEVDVLIVAKAALIRLGLKCNMQSLPGDVSPMQGRLAVTARQGDEEMQSLFACLDQATQNV